MQNFLELQSKYLKCDTVKNSIQIAHPRLLTKNSMTNNVAPLITLISFGVG
jgi:hypothetical protein